MLANLGEDYNMRRRCRQESLGKKNDIGVLVEEVVEYVRLLQEYVDWFQVLGRIDV
jgi:hypothetical protein